MGKVFLGECIPVLVLLSRVSRQATGTHQKRNIFFTLTLNKLCRPAMIPWTFWTVWGKGLNIHAIDYDDRRIDSAGREYLIL